MLGLNIRKIKGLYTDNNNLFECQFETTQLMPDLSDVSKEVMAYHVQFNVIFGMALLECHRHQIDKDMLLNSSETHVEKYEVVEEVKDLKKAFGEVLDKMETTKHTNQTIQDETMKRIKHFQKAVTQFLQTYANRMSRSETAINNMDKIMDEMKSYKLLMTKL